jgi:hypothetical protein
VLQEAYGVTCTLAKAEHDGANQRWQGAELIKLARQQLCLLRQRFGLPPAERLGVATTESEQLLNDSYCYSCQEP